MSTRRQGTRRSAVALAGAIALLVGGFAGGPAMAQDDDPVVLVAEDFATADVAGVVADQTPRLATNAGVQARVPGVGDGPDCVQAEDGTVVCLEVEPATDEEAAALVQSRQGASARVQVSPQAVQPYPSWCVSNGITNAYFGHRLAACGAWNGTLTTFEIVNGVRVQSGLATFALMSYVYTSATLGTWAHQFSISQSTASGEAVGYSVMGAFGCAGACTTSGGTIPVTALTNGVWHDYEAFGDTTATTPGAIGSGQSLWDFNYVKGSIISDTATMWSPTVRCDRAVPGASLGCVLPDWTPGITYYAASWPTFGPHIVAAQASGLPGGSPQNPLNRTTDQVLRDANRTLSCGNAPSIPLFSCDEYPFASTYQGAVNSGGGPRTYSWCQMTLPGPSSTGPLGYSVCMIDANENSLAGSSMNTVLFMGQRVMEGDPFYVQIS